MTAVLTVLVPTMVLITLGRLFRARVPDAAWKGIDRLNFELLFPCLIFAGAASRPVTLDDALVVGLGTWAVLTLGLALGWCLRRFGPKRFLDFAGAWQTAWRFNTAMALVAATAVGENAALMSVVIGFGVPVANVFAVSALSRGTGSGFGGILLQIAKNPFFIASVAGIALGASGYSLPTVIQLGVDYLAGAAIPLALMAVGATMDWTALVRFDRFTGGITLIKLVLLPLITYVTTSALGVPVHQATVLTVFAAIPTASGAHVLASVYGAERRLPATLIAQSTLSSMITLPFWIYILTK